jgi:cyclophilin family peptidyl-prolyl cis-trans isomerase/HEAT repeat protein
VRARLIAPALVVSLGGCVSTPAPAPVVVPVAKPLTTILRLEDQRVLKDPAPAAAPAPAPTPARGRRAAAPPPDLISLLNDPSARTRRRAALAIGRVGLAEGIAPLAARLATDPELEVRQMSAFALGLIGHREAMTPLRTALGDQSPIVRGRAAEALGLIGDAESATAIAGMTAVYVKTGAIAAIAADESGYPLTPEAEAVRLGLYALARLKAYDALSSVALDAGGRPVSRWWPVAYAFRRTADKKAAPVLRALAQGDGIYTRAFAARGLGVIKDQESFELLRGLAASTASSPVIGVEAVRALGELGDRRALATLVELLKVRTLHVELRVEVVRAIGALRTEESTEWLLDLLTDRAPAVRAEAYLALARSDPERFVLTLSGLDRDNEWTVRAAMAMAMAELPVETAAPLLDAMARDDDKRVLSSVLAAAAKRKTPGATALALDKLKAEDPVVRGAAASALGDLKPAEAIEALQAAAAGARDPDYVARASALAALAKFGREAALRPLEQALADPDWAVRLRAAQLLREIDPARQDAATIRPAPTRLDHAAYEDPALAEPPVSPHVFIDTDKGTIQIELAVLDAPITTRTFAELARSGYFAGVAIHRVVPNFVVQDGDPRGDGEGGPGFTIRDELNQRPYLRGAVGMALDWADTGGSQFFITHSPQPHLDARYTVFGQVISGLEVVDALARGDVIREVRVWTGGQ